MKFEKFGISPKILKSLDKLGFRKPTDIQYKSIGPIRNGEDVLAIAQTGTGKTAAFAIPIIDKLINQKSTYNPGEVKCVVMVPTRELAEQILKVFLQLGKHASIRVLSLYGGVDQDPQIAKLQEGIDVLISTPGRLFDLVSQKHLRLNKVDTLVLDEADHMLDLGFIKDIQDLIRFLPQKRQTLFFSATINPKIKKLAYSLVTNPIRIQISPKNPVARNIVHSIAFVEMDDKRFFLERVINENPDSKILIFVRTKVRAERVFNAMERVNIKCLTIHGDKNQKERFSSLDSFRKGDVKILIATDVSARGIDIPNVDYVVNYDMPEQEEYYVHRVGRTGRGTQKGFAVSFCSSEEKPLLNQIEKYVGGSIDVIDIKKEDYTETLDFSGEEKSDWKTLMKEAKTAEEEHKKIRRKRRKK
jgi:ATP-dependent RNA helicase RhlE